MIPEVENLYRFLDKKKLMNRRRRNDYEIANKA